MRKMSKRMYSVRCPIHPNQKIGLIGEDPTGEFDTGFWCKRCKAYKWFNEKDFRKFLTNGLFPEIK